VAQDGRVEAAAAAMALAAELGGRYLAGLDRRPVAPDAAMLAGLAALDGPFPEMPSDPLEVVRLLDKAAAPATVATAGGRYFGFVTGGTLPAALGANVLAAAFDQNAALEVMSPAAARLETIAAAWALDALGLPGEAAVGFTTGATMANLTGLAAARHRLLARAGWDAEADGLFGAPPLTVVVGDEVHVSLLKGLALLGLGRGRVIRVPVDRQGRLEASALPKLDARTILCLQAGNVNSGAFDPFVPAIARAREAGAWVHVDGAFGLWALAAPALRALAEGVAEADSWATDAHKWLNVPHDCGLAIVRDREALHAAMGVTAAYLIEGTGRDGQAFVPEISRRARGVEVWAALRSLGRQGLARAIEGCTAHARRFAGRLSAHGFEILNEVVLNQVLVAFGEDERTRRVIAAVQRDGTCWLGGTAWHGRAAMRLSVSSFATTADDVDLSVDAIVRAAAAAN
jgi:glutamate/tyrosine decarboxylase-like PLP-dependent enzyme